jgi:hypothetical protein
MKHLGGERATAFPIFRQLFSCTPKKRLYAVLAKKAGNANAAMHNNCPTMQLARHKPFSKSGLHLWTN